MGNVRKAFGVDIGGTNVVIGLVTENGDVSDVKKFQTKDFNDYRKLIDALSVYIKSFKDECIEGIGIGAPNGNFYKGTIEYPANLPWKGITPFAAELTEKCGSKVFLTNDANAAAIGEMCFGAAKGKKDFIMITLGTGVGSGIVINGNLVLGSNGMAGELGHTCIIPYGRKHPGTGLRGSLESYCSAKGIVETAKEFIAKFQSHSPLKFFEEKDITAKLIYEHALKGDALSLQIFEYTGELLGKAFANFVMFSAPSLIVLFGGLSKAGGLILNPAKKYMEENLLEVFKNTCSIQLSGLPEDDAAILGAASLVFQNVKN